MQLADEEKLPTIFLLLDPARCRYRLVDVNRLLERDVQVSGQWVLISAMLEVQITILNLIITEMKVLM